MIVRVVSKVTDYYPNEYRFMLKSYPKGIIHQKKLGDIIPLTAHLIKYIDPDNIVFIVPISFPRELSLLDFEVQRVLLWNQDLAKQEKDMDKLQDMLLEFVDEVFMSEDEKKWWFRHRDVQVIYIPPIPRGDSRVLIQIVEHNAM